MRFSRNTVHAVLAPCAIALLLTAAHGCNGEPASVSMCETLCDCVTCPEGYLADCKASVDEAEREAADAGCAEEFGAHAACWVDEFRCDNRSISTSHPRLA